MTTGTTTPQGDPGAAPSTTKTPVPLAVRREGVTVQEGDIVLVLIEPGVRRPMLVVTQGMVDVYDGQISTKVVAQSYRVSGTLFCEPQDHASMIFRVQWGPNGDPARVTGRPDRLMPNCYAECLGWGQGIGQWIPRPTRLPGA